MYRCAGAFLAEPILTEWGVAGARLRQRHAGGMIIGDNFGVAGDEEGCCQCSGTRTVAVVVERVGVVLMEWSRGALAAKSSGVVAEQRAM